MVRARIDDPERVAGIRAFDVLGKPPRTDLVAVADLAARVCGAPLATITIITDTEQHQIASVGFEGGICSVDDSLCAAILHEDAAVVVPDCREDPRFRDNPFVDGRLENVRFYASYRLVTRDGLAIGTLGVFDHAVRHLDAAQIEALRTLAERVVDILELSLSSRELASKMAEVEVMRAELEQSNVRLASFAGQVSHDLKTPLTSMSLSLSVIREELARQPGETETVSLLDRAISGSSRMAAVIDDVLAYARLGGNLHHDDVDLAEVVQHVRTDLGGRLEGVAFQVESLPVVSGDAVQLRALVQNLVDNAAKYADPARPALIRLRGMRSAMGFRVEVTDNGRGVATSQLERIFDPMARADWSVDGSGIGLATCRRIAEAHGGRIGLEQVDTGGTTAWFELPG